VHFGESLSQKRSGASFTCVLSEKKEQKSPLLAFPIFSWFVVWFLSSSPLGSLHACKQLLCEGSSSPFSPFCQPPPARVIQLLLITFNTPSTNVVRLLQGVGSQFLFLILFFLYFFTPDHLAPSLTFCPNIDFQVLDPEAFPIASHCKLNEVLKHFERDCFGGCRGCNAIKCH